MAKLREVHDKSKSFSWEPERVHPTRQHPTNYRIPRRTKDPFRHLLREYFVMEREKDNRQYGILEDVVVRIRGFAHAFPRWVEVLKPLLGITVFGEYAALKCCAMLIEAVDNPELRQGYLAQMLDELRHTNVEAYLIRYLTKVAPDPAGFNSALKDRALDPILRAGRAAFETFLADDPITCALSLQVIAETAYTNPLFVATTEIAAANNDPITPSTFLSIQSDEARHMANGYATLAAVMSDSDNLPRLQRDFDACFWRQHAFLDRFLSLVYDYFSSVRLRSYRGYWEEWVWEGWVGGYIDRLAPFGLTVPGSAEDAHRNVGWAGHELALVSAALWPVHFWRTDSMVERDFDYLDANYPGWYSRYGSFWEDYRRLAQPAEGGLAIDLLDTFPLICRVCQMPVRPVEGTAFEQRVLADSAGQRHAFCSEMCEELYIAEPHRYVGRTWWELNDGLSLSEYVVKAGLVRADGETLVAQPHLSVSAESLWKLADLRRVDVEIRDPLTEVPADKVRSLPTPHQPAGAALPTG